MYTTQIFLKISLSLLRVSKEGRGNVERMGRLVLLERRETLGQLGRQAIKDPRYNIMEQ